jgi:hypothetical protein
MGRGTIAAMPLFRRQTAEEKARKHVEKQTPDESMARIEALLAESSGPVDAGNPEKDEADREKIERILAPYLAVGQIAHLVKFKQGEQIFTDYLAVTPRSLLIMTGLFADSPDVEVLPYRGVTSIAGGEGHLTVGIDGRRCDLHRIEPPERATEIVAYVQARL